MSIYKKTNHSVVVGSELGPNPKRSYMKIIIIQISTTSSVEQFH
jgi:hypothetical protein